MSNFFILQKWIFSQCLIVKVFMFLEKKIVSLNKEAFTHFSIKLWNVQGENQTLLSEIIQPVWKYQVDILFREIPYSDHQLSRTSSQNMSWCFGGENTALIIKASSKWKRKDKPWKKWIEFMNILVWDFKEPWFGNEKTFD